MHGSEFRVQDLAFGVIGFWSLRFEIWGLEFRVLGLGSEVLGSRLRV